MNQLFVDTRAWDALADKGDKNHQQLSQQMKPSDSSKCNQRG